MTQDSLQGGSHNLDLLRAVAVLSVYSAHLSHAVGFYNAGSLGRFGVIIFFVHTSCVLMASLERLQASGLSRLGELCRAFYLRRFFRIYPLAIFCILLVPLLQVPAHPTADYHWIGAKALAANLALSQNLFYASNALNVLWSLPLEVQMYLLLPLVYLFIRRYRFGALAFLGAAVIAALTLPRLSGRLGVFTFAPCFAAGVMAYFLCGESRRRLAPWIWPLVVFAVILLFHPLDNISLYAKLPLAWALSLLLGLTFPFIRDIECNWLNRISHWVAEKSYGIYLSHSFIIWCAVKLMVNRPLPLRVLVLVSGSLFIPVILYRCIEKPMIVAGVRISSRVLERTVNQSRRERLIHHSDGIGEHLAVEACKQV